MSDNLTCSGKTPTTVATAAVKLLWQILKIHIN